MVSRCRTAACNWIVEGNQGMSTGSTIVNQRTLRVLLLATALAFVSGFARASLPVFKAHYTGSFDVGMHITGSVVRELARQADGQWLFSLQAQTLVASIEETSRFSVRRQQLIPQRYEYLRTVLGKSRHALLTFDWPKGVVTNNVDNQPWKLGIKPGTLDKLNYQLQLRLDLKRGKRPLRYVVADGGVLKTYTFEVIGEETLDTALGPLATVKVQRRRDDGKNRLTEIWLAKSLDYLVVKLSQTNHKGQRSDLLIDQLAAN